MSDSLNLNGRAMELFQSGDLADCVIAVDQQDDGQEKTEEFKVHKFVLVLNSDVFSAMFRHKSTKEFRESRIHVKGSTPTAVHQMLIFVYSGKLPEDYDIGKDAIDLTKIAKKYEIKPLVELIEKQLIENLSLENLFDYLELVDQCQLRSLKSACGQMILMNLPVVKNEIRWLEMKKKMPDLVISILDNFANRFHNAVVLFKKWEEESDDEE